MYLSPFLRRVAFVLAVAGGAATAVWHAAGAMAAGPDPRGRVAVPPRRPGAATKAAKAAEPADRAPPKRPVVAVTEVPLFDFDIRRQRKRNEDADVSPNLRRYFSTEQTGDGQIWVKVDGRYTGPYDQVAGGAAFSGDSRRVGFVARRGSKWLYVIDGKPVEVPNTQDAVGAAAGGYNLVFSADGHAAYTQGGDGGAGAAVVLDGRAQKTYLSLLSRPVFSPTGGHLAYLAMRAGSGGPAAEVVVRDGVEDKAYADRIKSDTLTFSPDGRHFAFAFVRSAPPIVVADGEERWQRDFTGRVSQLTYSPEGKHLAYLLEGARIDGGTESRWAVVLDNVAQEPFEAVHVHRLTFSPDGNRLAYIIERRMEGTRPPYIVVVDGKAGRPYGQLGARTPQFSPDSKRVVYVASVSTAVDARCQLVDDGKESPQPYTWIGPPSFTPDGMLVYVGERAAPERGVAILVDGVEAECEPPLTDMVAWGPFGLRPGMVAETSYWGECVVEGSRAFSVGVVALRAGKLAQLARLEMRLADR